MRIAHRVVLPLLPLKASTHWAARDMLRYRRFMVTGMARVVMAALASP